MKYRQLTKEQFESLHKEFAQFLATQKIDASEWKKIKEEKPTMATEEMDIFSDMVWEDVLKKVEYLEHFSERNINLFKCEEAKISRIVITINKDINVLEKEGFEWLFKNTGDSAVEYFRGDKVYTKERNLEIFELIEKGSTISKGEIYGYFSKLIESK